MIVHGDCELVMSTMESKSFGAVVTDPPYGTHMFDWDTHVPAVSVWAECLRLTKPGGYLWAFGSPRTDHVLATNIERAGWTIVDKMAWIRPGFPRCRSYGRVMKKAGAVDWDTWTPWKTAMLPAMEPIVVAMRPREKRLAESCIEHGVGGIHIGRRRGATEPFPSNVVAHHDVGLSLPFVVTPKPARAERVAHPTPKDVGLMRHLVRLAMTHGGHPILDPFAGSGTTGVACALEGIPFIGIEQSLEFVTSARSRLAKHEAK